MPLITSWAARGPEYTTDKSIQQRTYRIGTDTDWIDYRETTFKNNSQWYGFTESAASAQVEAGGSTANQPTDGGVHSWSCNETDRVCGAYMIERAYERKQTDRIGTSVPPTLGSVSFNPAQDLNRTSMPNSVSVSTATAGAKIKYKVDVYSGSTLVQGSWLEINSNSGSISLDSNLTANGATIDGIKYHEYQVISAYSIYTTLGGTTVIGDTSISRYAVRAPDVAGVTFTPASGSSVTFNASITVQSAGADLMRFRYLALDQSGNWVTDSAMPNEVDNGSSNSVTLSPSVVAYNRTWNSRQVWKAVRIYVTPVIEKDGVEYAGTEVYAEYGENVPTFGAVSANYGSGTVFVSLPQSIQLSSTSANGIDWTMYGLTSGGNWSQNSSGGSGRISGSSGSVSATTEVFAAGRSFDSRARHRVCRIDATPFAQRGSYYWYGTTVTFYYYVNTPTVGSITGLSPAYFQTTGTGNFVGTDYFPKTITWSKSGNVSGVYYEVDGSGASLQTGYASSSFTIVQPPSTSKYNLLNDPTYYAHDIYLVRVRVKAYYNLDGITYVGTSFFPTTSSYAYYYRTTKFYRIGYG